MEDKQVYLIVEINYLKKNNRTVYDENKDLFPFDWYSINDYKLKTEILTEAITNKVKVIDTKKYKDRSCI